jgi:hypothetical protein
MKINTTVSVWPLLCSVLIVLKLLGKITLPWLWVLAPLWIPLCILLPLMALILFFYYRVSKDLLGVIKKTK